MYARGFNDSLHNGENVGGPRRCDSVFEPFVNMVKDCKMKEFHSHGNDYIWGGMRYKWWIQSKLDRCVGNKEWYDIFPVTNQGFLEKRGSDHRSVLVNLMSSQDTYRGQFRFDKRILHKPLVKETILAAWNGYSKSATVADMIRSYRRALSKWKKTNNMNSQDKIHQIQVS